MGYPVHPGLYVLFYVYFMHTAGWTLLKPKKKRPKLKLSEWIKYLECIKNLNLQGVSGVLPA
jgi:hypothetical protein